MDEKKWYDEHRELPSPWEWIIIVVWSVAIVAYGYVVYVFVLDGPRNWDFGQLPDTPAEAIYSTEEPDRLAPAARQLPKLPEAQGENPRKPWNAPLRERGPGQ